MSCIAKGTTPRTRPRGIGELAARQDHLHLNASIVVPPAAVLDETMAYCCVIPKLSPLSDKASSGLLYPMAKKNRAAPATIRQTTTNATQTNHSMMVPSRFHWNGHRDFGHAGMAMANDNTAAMAHY